MGGNGVYLAFMLRLIGAEQDGAEDAATGWPRLMPPSLRGGKWPRQ